MKNFVRGVGVGILFTTLVFAIAYMLKGNEISDDEIRQRAARLGMVEENTQVVKPKEVTPQAAGDDKANVSGDETAQPEVLQPGTAQAVTDTQVTDSNTIAEGTPDVVRAEENVGSYTTTSDDDSVQLQIEKGMDGVTISQMLQQSGVITDAADFNRYLSNNRLQMDIACGEFVLRKNMPYEEIVQKISYCTHPCQ